MRKLILSVFIIMGVFSLSACNTMSGVGKDVQKGGEKLENAADKSK